MWVEKNLDEPGRPVYGLQGPEGPVLQGQVSQSRFHPYHANLWLKEMGQDLALDQYLAFLQAVLRDFPNLKLGLDRPLPMPLQEALRLTGFELVRCTYDGRVNRDKLQVRRIPLPGRLVQLSDLAASQVRELRQQVFADYKANHAEISALGANLDPEDVLAALLAHMTPSLSWVLVDDRQAVQAYLLVEDQGEDEAFVTYVGSRMTAHRSRTFYAQALSRLLAMGRTELTFEMDSTDDQAMILARLLDVAPDSYDTYRHQEKREG